MAGCSAAGCWMLDAGCWLAGWLAGDWLAGWLAGSWLLDCWLAGWLAGRLAGWLAGRPAGRLGGWLASTPHAGRKSSCEAILVRSGTYLLVPTLFANLLQLYCEPIRGG